MRIGSGPNGNYLHADRKGIYYKKALTNAGSFLQISWLVLVVIGVIIGIVYFYFYSEGNFQSMREAFLTQTKM